MIIFKEKRFNFIDILKGMAILLVVFGHFQPKNVNFFFYEFMNKMVYVFHMPLFMCISGFLFSSSKDIKSLNDYVRLVVNKINRLLIPYFAISILILLTKLFFQQFIKLENPVPTNFIWHLFFCPENGIANFLWFIYTLFVIFLVFPILKCIVRNKLLLFLLLVALFFIKGSELFQQNAVFMYLFYFYLGTLFFKYKEKIFENNKPWLRYLCLIALVAFFGFGLNLNDNYFLLFIIRKSIKLLASVAGIFLFVYLSLAMKEESLSGKIFKKIGIFSAPIYLLHTASMAPIKLVLNDFMKLNIFAFSISSILIIGAGVILPIIITKILITRSSVLTLLLLGTKPQLFQKE